MSSLAHGLASPPNASRYAAPNLSFQILPIHVDGLLGFSPSKTHLKSISCNGASKITFSPKTLGVLRSFGFGPSTDPLYPLTPFSDVLDDGIYIGTDFGEIVVLGRPITDEEGRVRVHRDFWPCSWFFARIS